MRHTSRTAYRYSSALLIALALGGAGCALRLAGAEHYVGPVWFRYTEPPLGRAYVSQVRAVGLLGELGTPSGLTIGGVDRVAVAPTGATCAGDAPGARQWQWTRFGLPGSLQPEEWYLSPFYLRGADVPAPCFTRRVTYGVTAVGGGELAALSIGVTARTHTQPPPDAVSAFEFAASRPLDTRFTVWRVAEGDALPITSILKEVDP
jgi:hypothetical protein